MTDLVLAYDPALGGFDLVLTDTDLATDDGWKSAIILSAFCDRRANPDDGLPAGADPRGWWADRVLPLDRPQAGATTNPDRIGSRMWLLEKEVQSSANLLRAKRYLTEAFAWITQDGYASSIAITVSYPRAGWLAWQAVATWADGTTTTHADELQWGAS
jgi:phage gp46-like protein